MKRLAKTVRFLVVTMVTSCAASIPARAADPIVTVGASVSYPEIAGVWLSLWPDTSVSVDLRLTPVTLDAGGTAHIPIAGTLTGWRHDLLINAMVGYVHSGVMKSGALPYNGFRFFGDVGYGLLGRWDFRLTAGIGGQQASDDSWSGPAFTAMAVFGKVF